MMQMEIQKCIKNTKNKGDFVRVEWYNLEGKLSGLQINEYDNTGNIVKKVLYDGNGNVISSV